MVIEDGNPPPLPPSILSTIHKWKVEAHIAWQHELQYYSRFVFDFPVENGPYFQTKARKEALKNVGPDNLTHLTFSLLTYDWTEEAVTNFHSLGERIMLGNISNESIITIQVFRKLYPIPLIINVSLINRLYYPPSVAPFLAQFQPNSLLWSMQVM